MNVVIGDIAPYTQATASASQTVFGTNWTANAASDVIVYQTPSGSPPNDATQILSYPSQYSVAFIGGSQQVQVTLVTGANAGDIVTITRMTPDDYLNLYSNTNFTPSMLNNDFGILTLVDQQAELVNQLIGPRYNYSAVITPVVDTILPILGANQAWVKNSGNTAFVPYTLPSSGIAPSAATYVTKANETSTLPNSFQLLGTANQIGLTVGTNQLTVGIPNNPIMPGTAGMGIPIGTTAQRAIPASNISLRYNTDLQSIEYYNSVLATWAQLVDDDQVAPGTINQLAYYAATGDLVSGLNGINSGALVTGATGVPTWLGPLTNGQLIIGSTGAIPVATTLTQGSGITITNGAGSITISATGTGGTVTSFSAGNLSPLFTTSVATATTTPALSFSLSNAGANTYFGNATGSPAAPSYTSAAALTRTNDTNVTLTLGGSPTVALLAAASLTLGWSGQLAIARGGTGVASVTTAPTASAWAGWDANSNLSANNSILGYATTATAAATTTLTVASAYQQFFTGSTTQTVVMPVTSTLVLGQQYEIVNNSTGNLTINSSGGNNILTMTTNTIAYLTCINTGVTDATGWYYEFVNKVETTGSVTSVGSGTGLTGGPITTTGTLSFASIAAHSLWANTTSSSAVPTVIGTNTFLQKVAIQTFTSGTSTYTPTTGMVFATVEIVGGGGGGGGAASGGAGTSGMAAGGGGGGYCRKTYTAALIGASATVVVGAGGPGGAAGNNAGTNGNDSTFTPAGAGAILTASAGKAGGGSASSATTTQSSNAGAGGSALNGDINIPGGNGNLGTTIVGASGWVIGGSGGSSTFGNGAVFCNATSSATGLTGQNYGSGGGGGFAAAANEAGGNGAAGYCIITEYIAI